MNSMKTLLLLLLVLTGQQAVAQIVIGGNVYGGGNAGDTDGSTAVTVLAGDVNAVFGGARMADVGGSAFVHIDGEHASNYIVINKVYGGNDIAGTIGSKAESKVLPDVLTQKTENGIDNSWDAFVRISSKSSTPDEELPNDKKIYIGQLFGGGNGDYDYVTEKYTVDDGNGGTKQVENPYYGMTSPVLGKTYLEILGGSIVYAYGGGNNATITAKTVISLNNPSKVVNSIIDAKNPNAGTGGELLTNARFEDKMDINTTFSYPGSAEYQIGRLFGGNNKAEMKIRPRWNLQRGRVRILYGGGNEGRMTSPEGLLLEIKGAGMVVDNVYGGCRKADVRPLRDGTPVTGSSIQLDPDDNEAHIPGGYAARVRVLDGDVNNVYGGNDISGNVYGGNTVGIFTNIHGNVYGGGNGSYAYTDNPKLKDSRRWGDFYYNPKEILGLSGDTFSGLESAEALNIFRPNAEKVSIIVRGTPEKTVSVEGALYVGGNSASLRDQSSTASSVQKDSTHIKIGSYVIIDQVFLGNNGENMIKFGEADPSGHNEGVLFTMARTDLTGNGSKFNSMNLKTKEVFAKYMEGCAMKVKPTVLFEDTGRGDPYNYESYSTRFGSFYCGGNVGSIIVPGKMTVDFEGQVIIYDKVVGGCNNANVYATDYNTEYLGGILGNPDPAPTGSAEDAIGDKLVLNFSGLKIQPKRWKDPSDKSQGLVWNIIKASTGEEVNPTNLQPGTSTSEDLDRRFKGGNIYGGCYNTGHINGNVVINLNATIVDRKGDYAIFDQVEQNEGEAILYGHESYNITKRLSGVILDEQGMDVLGKALNVFGGGYGPESEIWGSTTINLNAGYTFQIFGGGEKGAVGNGTYNQTTGKLDYTYDPRYSCYVNMKGASKGVYRGHADDSDDMAEAEFIYGGSFEAPIAGNTVINLGNGRIFNSFAGSCNADILGHTETYIGRSGVDAQGKDILGFPWIRDHVYGGNDLGGQILGGMDLSGRVSDFAANKVYKVAKTVDEETIYTKPQLTASAYMEYIQGRVDYIFGGCYGDYDYTDSHFSAYTYSNGKSRLGFTKPRLDNAFVNIRPNDHADNALNRIFGAGQGSLKGFGVDSMQNRSYILIDIPQTITKFHDTEVFGAGANCGLGMGVSPTGLVPDKASAIIDLIRGQVKNTFGGSFKEGVTRRSVINVPVGATIRLDSIFGGAYGVDPMYPCDVYEAQVNYRSEDARVKTIFGGNNSADRTLYGQVNISAPVYTYKDDQDSSKDTYATIFGAGFGKDTWSQYTEVNLLNGAQVWEVYGGGNNGKVLNTQSLAQWRHDTGAGLDLSLPGYENTAVTYKDKDNHDFHLDAGLTSPLAHAVSLDGQKYNTNVHIHQGATVLNYAYGGGLGADAVVSGTTYIDLLGGTVAKDLYAAGTSGPVLDYYKAKDGQGGTFTASSTAYIEGGTVRNVYGGGWAGDVGYHDKTTTATTTDILGETYVYIGIRKDQTSLPEGYGFYKGVPAIQRNAYSGGEGGSVFGESHLVMNNGYIGFTYNTTNGKYEEKLHDETWTDHVGKDRLSDCGNLFGGGYDDNSSVDHTNVTVWGGIIRNSVFGGGEIATVGRGKVKESDTDNKTRVLDAIYKHGKTNIEIFNGHVRRNVFGGGKGYNILGYGGIHGFYTDGYVFGQTEVHIHGGEIGTEAGLAEGYGNVFGGGDVGFVYGLGTATNESTGSPGHVYYKKGDQLTEDCKVVIAPMLQIKKNGTSVNFDNKTYQPYDYVPTEYLNTLPADKTDASWTNLYMGGQQSADDMEERGVHIRNAVFAGGNVSSNSESYANSTTVFGNTTATLYDVYHHDFITVGTEHTGGLYGGGNLSVVNGYRELNITNYGTDYYGLDQQITLEEYQKLTNRERAYFKLEYLCQHEVTIGVKTYHQGDRINEDEYNAFDSTYKTEYYWKQYGFCSIYAGRLLNTIQRADFCGVFGSRLVLQGAKDRVADVADATEYTINRIGELSLNQQHFTPGSDAEIHGNYFGIYNIVNYLGNLTSDVRFVSDKRRYVNNGEVAEDTKTYFQYKVDNLTKRDRNNGTSWNQVALASGVYLELTTEMSTPKNKVYGDITGVVELDLINVKKDIEGGGYVYARNEHGQWHEISHENTLLSPYNMKDGDEALTKKIYTYDTDAEHLFPYQTSGNFIHKSKRIVDDCYPNNGVYTDGYQKSPAHYWFIKGEVYIYDQVVSAYAGSASAYSKEVKIPLTITAGSNGKLQLLNVQPSLYAYYANSDQSSKIGSDGVKVDNESTTYQLNDVISWWDWHQLSQNEQKYFVKETRVNVDSCTIDSKPYAAGTYVLEDDKSIHTPTAWDTFKSAGHTVKDARGETVTDLANLFRSSNNISHETGYVLTLDMNSPKDWDSWYSPKLVSGGSKINKEAYDAKSKEQQETYRQGPTYKLTGASGLYGQREYSIGEVISEEVYNDYNSTVSPISPKPEGQATAEPAYVALEDFGNTQAGNAIGQTEYNNGSTDKSKFAPAMVCINTIQIGDEEYILMGDLVSGTTDALAALVRKYREYNNSRPNADQLTLADAEEYVLSHLSNAYYINSNGLYGGQYYDATKNYGAISSWSTLTDDRTKFSFNYDALDVLVDSEYHGEGTIATYYKTPYSDIKSVEYDAYYNGTGTLTYYDNDDTQHTITSGGHIDREAYEKVRNDQLHYTRLSVDAGSDKQKFYIVKETMIDNGNPYAKGQDISEKDYNAMSTASKAKVDVVEIQKVNSAKVKYYCYENYTPSASLTTESGTAGQKGSIITDAVFSDPQVVPNYQKEFSIQGSEPTETTTLYVSRESNAKDVTSEKIISVVYQYTYYEADDEGEGVSLVNELHVLNIHLQLESGAPQIGQLNAPPAVLPGSTLGLKAPSVNPGLYEILTNGWEMFDSEPDAQLHRNGKPFTVNGTQLYWYQNQKVFLAFYSKTYLGKTYSNYVPLTVANYHDLDAVMKDKEHHLYVDHPSVMRNSKIYIDNRDCESDATKSELDLLKDFYDLSVTGLTGHASLNSRVQGGANLEFILNSNVSPKKYTDWSPIGNDTKCFSGNFHGDGYTISGLNKSLFGSLCGSVYNLGVTGSFTGAGIAEMGDGYVENCWVSTSSTAAKTAKPVFGTPNIEEGTNRPIRIVNCYYQEEDAAATKPATDDDNKKQAYTNHSGNYGIPTRMGRREFHNGTVAYNLNGFYLNKRYHDHTELTSGTAYQYLKWENGDPSQEQEPGYSLITGFYPAAYEPKYGDVGYVERRYQDGDFIYAGGTIPDAYDIRMRVGTGSSDNEITYAPIWPDDYIFFGQTLTYGYNTRRLHEEQPAHISKSGSLLAQSEESNRVYRAPAYFRSKDMDVAHFNADAYVVAYTKPSTVTDTNLHPAYPDMTAIDFYGHQDNTWALGSASNHFYPPLLDDDGLIGINTAGQTQNLLVYEPSSGNTLTVLNNYFGSKEPTFAFDNTEIFASDIQPENYHRVAVANTGEIVGHLVPSTTITTSDHLLVDKQEFNCPIGYKIGEGFRMWYQRTPDKDKYVKIDSESGKSMGWDDICLPFSVDLVTTQQKGEITHFYNGSTKGHEYWLRELTNIQNGDPVALGTFTYPLVGTEEKNYTNTFLYDYYYSRSSFDDANQDYYQNNYYNKNHKYSGYPRSVADKPYLIGFPSAYYYEFDLKGGTDGFRPNNTREPIDRLDKQVITFASKASTNTNRIEIGVSDDEMKQEAYSGYLYCTNYLNKDLAAHSYLLSVVGDKYEEQTVAAKAVPFRPYFVLAPSPTRGDVKAAHNIIFSDEDSQIDMKTDIKTLGVDEDLLINGGRKKIMVESQLHYTADVRIVTPAGLTLTTYSIQPSEYIETRIQSAGVYIVYADNGKYVKKVIVR